MDRYPNAAAGLRLMFVGQLLMIAGVVLIWVPLVGSLLTIGGIAAFIFLIAVIRAVLRARRISYRHTRSTRTSSGYRGRKR